METYKTYLVRWEIELTALNAREAAEEALRIHRDPHSLATIFTVAEFTDKPMDYEEDTIDLSLPKEEAET